MYVGTDKSITARELEGIPPRRAFVDARTAGQGFLIIIKERSTDTEVTMSYNEYEYE